MSEQKIFDLGFLPIKYLSIRAWEQYVILLAYIELTL